MGLIPPRHPLTKSVAYRAHALRWVAGGGASTQSKRADRFPASMPTAIKSARGPWCWDLDDNQYLDLIGALGPTVLGPQVAEDAIRVALREGAGSFSLPSEFESPVAARFCRAVGWPDGQVRFVSTGTEAAMGACRIARMAREPRPIIVTMAECYHGWADWFTATRPLRPGIPDALTEVVRTASWGDIDSLRAALFPGDVAAVILEPMLPRGRWADAERHRTYLTRLRDEAHAAGALVIFDEVIAGGRLAVGGGSEYFGVTPDLAIYGKAFGGGLPFAAIVGERRLMEHAWVVSGTYSANALALAACWATLTEYEEHRAIDRIWDAGAQLRAALTPLGPGWGFTVEGLDVHLWLDFSGNQERAMAFTQAAADTGLLLHPSAIKPCALLADADQQQARDWLAEACAHLTVRQGDA